MDGEYTLILSPHCDDVPLSLGAALLARALGPVRVLVVFSRSRYFGGVFLEDESRVTELRHGEELRAAAMAGYEVGFLEFGEPGSRPGFTMLGEAFDAKRRVEDDPVYADVAGSVERLLEEGTRVLAPLGCGGHIDHRIVSRIARETGVVARDRMAYYEDLPYAYQRDPRKTLPLVPPGCESHRLPSAGCAPKEALLGCYQSQLRESDLERIREHLERFEGESIWLPPADGEDRWADLRTSLRAI